MIYDIPVKDFLSPHIIMDPVDPESYTELPSRKFSTALNLYFVENHKRTGVGSYRFWIATEELDTLNALYEDWYLVWYDDKFHYRINTDPDTVMLLKLSL